MIYVYGLFIIYLLISIYLVSRCLNLEEPETKEYFNNVINEGRRFNYSELFVKIGIAIGLILVVLTFPIIECYSFIKKKIYKYKTKRELKKTVDKFCNDLSDKLDGASVTSTIEYLDE